MTRLLAEQGMTPASVSALVLRGDQVVMAHLAERPMQPASTMKLVTTLVSLEHLGPVFRGRTELLTNGDVKNGVLKGDLVLRGGADADLSGEVLEGMLRTLSYAGIKRIDGQPGARPQPVQSGPRRCRPAALRRVAGSVLQRDSGRAAGQQEHAASRHALDR